MSTNAVPTNVLQPASSSVSGAITTGAQTLAGVKLFPDGVAVGRAIDSSITIAAGTTHLRPGAIVGSTTVVIIPSTAQMVVGDMQVSVGGIVEVQSGGLLVSIY